MMAAIGVRRGPVAGAKKYPNHPLPMVRAAPTADSIHRAAVMSIFNKTNPTVDAGKRSKAGGQKIAFNRVIFALF
jgi:hypothetical protein